MRYPDKPPPAGYRLVPEVAAAFPKVSRRRQDVHVHAAEGLPLQRRQARSRGRVRAGDQPHARARRRCRRRSATRGRSSAPTTSRPAGRAGRPASSPAATRSSSGSRGRSATSPPGRRCRSSAPSRRRCRPAPRACARFPGAGPYYVTEYRPNQRVVVRRNRFYGGNRAHHVDGFDVDLSAGSAPGDARPGRGRQGGLGLHGGRAPPRAGSRPRREVRASTRSGSSSIPASRSGCSSSTRRVPCSATTRSSGWR